MQKQKRNKMLIFAVAVCMVLISFIIINHYRYNDNKQEGTEIAVMKIPNGMRAFIVPIYSNSMPDIKLLHADCVVDVLVSYRLPKQESKDDALSTIKLSNIKMLAISEEKFVSKLEDGKEKQSSRPWALVTLLVDTKQAEVLSRAIETGSISLSLSKSPA